MSTIQYSEDVPRGDVEIFRPRFLHLLLPMSSQLPLRQQKVRRGDVVVLVLVERAVKEEFAIKLSRVELEVARARAKIELY